ncbi:MAG: class I SAM-dependent methyltransferase [Desulfobulbaceae bacterium]|jgi:16S rRNA (guanine1516-N2)-methyltransferase|nr:class I SAM-dependent methyltransferase [Desulfobulbaceae bacterium]
MEHSLLFTAGCFPYRLSCLQQDIAQANRIALVAFPLFMVCRYSNFLKQVVCNNRMFLSMNRFSSKTPPRIGVAWTDPALEGKARRLARTMGLPPAPGHQCDVVLQLTPSRLELSCPGHPSLNGPVAVDFVRGPAGYRRRRGGSEALLRALGHKANRRTMVMDATGGWGDDALVMAAHGCEVLVVERHPVLAALLLDGIRRAAEHPATGEIAGRMRLVRGDSPQVMDQLRAEGTIIDVVYIDPMFPERRKSAKVKKKVQILQLLIGRENDAERLLDAALRTARKRVVVKRPAAAPFLGGIRPSHSFRGRTVRFDVFLTGIPAP